MKIVFFGTPKFGSDVLQKLLLSSHQVVAVVCQPDRLGNRNKLTQCHVKQFAEAQGLNVLQFENVSSEGCDILREFGADVFVTAAYGQMLSQEILDMTRFGVLNVHGSLLPKFRGASPVQSAIIEGESVTGVTIMKSALKMDAGDILMQEKIFIENSDDNLTLMDKMAEVGGDVLLRVLSAVEKGEILPQKQEEKQATYCKKITKEMAKICFEKNSVEVDCLIRGLYPAPVAFFSLSGRPVKVCKAEVVEAKGEAGTVVQCDKNALVIACKVGGISVKVLQFAGGKPIAFRDAVNGRKINLGDRCD